jgi:erythromycin esterase
MKPASDKLESLNADERVIINWLEQNSFPIRHIEAGNGAADLQPLKSVLKDVRVIGLGEATHGTHECYLLKHRLLEFLVTEMGFNNFVLEASFSACQAINDYVLEGKGDLAALLTAQGYVVWDIEEILEMLDWLHSYNKAVKPEKKVHFLGMDLWHNEYGREKVIDYLRNFVPEMVDAARIVFGGLTTADGQSGFLISEEEKKKVLGFLPKLQELLDTLTQNQGHLVGVSSQDEFELIRQYILVMKQRVLVITASVRPDSQGEPDPRDTNMVENLLFWIERGGPKAKFVFSAHNWHIQTNEDEVKLGPILRKKLGKSYYALSFEFNQGSFHTRIMLDDHRLGDLKAVTLPQAPKGSLPWYMAAVGNGDLLMNLRSGGANQVVEEWLHVPQITYNASWVEPDDSTFCREIRLIPGYDGILFVCETSPSHPTLNALKTIANREGI